ncbi:MAG: hypothetical protein HFI33_10775 [Lachnospiraceae bacterium]|nr:hypothetical protein [Lachnospiraceae bacterium]
MKQSRRQLVAAVTALGLSFLCMVVVYFRFTWIYAIADDVIMRDIASGAFTGTPDGHLIFIKFVLGWFISRCYLLLPFVDWYGFILVGVMFLGMAACLYRGFGTEKSMIWKAVYGALVLLLHGHVMLFHVAQFEWTLCAAFAGAQALFFYVTLRSRGENVAVYGLLLMTFCIRSDIFWMLMPGFGIFYIWKHVSLEKQGESRQGRRFSLHICCWGLPAAVFLSVGIVLFVEQLAYGGEEWKSFQRFQTARSEVYDYYGVPVYEKNPEFFMSQGITSQEVRSLRHYALYLVEDMDAEKMELLAGEAKRQNSQDMGVKGRLRQGILLAAEQFFTLDYAPMSLYGIFLALYLLLYGWKKDRQGLCYVLLLLCFQGFLWLALGVTGRLPERVAQSLHVADLVMMVGALCQMKAFPGKRLEKPLLVGGGVCFLILTSLCWKNTLHANWKKMENDGNYQLFKEYCKKQTDTLFFIETFRAEPVGGAQVTAQGDFSLNRCLTLGDWYSTSPLDQERFAALGISQVKEALLTGEQVYYVVRDVEGAGFFGDYIRETEDNLQVSLQDVVTLEGRSYYLYQVNSI